jgi:hypothetical protein
VFRASEVVRCRAKENQWLGAIFAVTKASGFISQALPENSCWVFVNLVEINIKI